VFDIHLNRKHSNSPQKTAILRGFRQVEKHGVYQTLLWGLVLNGKFSNAASQRAKLVFL
jgi:hypothetical protein